MRINDITGGATESADRNWIGIIAKSESFKVAYSEVLYIEQVGKKLRIQKEIDYVYVSGRISNLANSVDEPFFQCHSYLLINLSRVHLMTNGVIIFDNQMSTRIGQNCFNKTRKRFNQYLLGE